VRCISRGHPYRSKRKYLPPFDAVENMDRDDIITFGLALIAAVITFYVVSTTRGDGSLLFILAFVVFGALLFGKSFVQSAH